MNANRTRRMLGLTAAALAITLPTARAAGQIQGRPGEVPLWIEAGIGGAQTVAANCEACFGTAIAGVPGHLSAGVALRPRVSIGVDLLGWNELAGEDGPTSSLRAISGVIRLYPPGLHRLHVTVGVGRARYAFDGGYVEGYGQGRSIHVSGTSLLARAGYDVPLWRRLWLVPYAGLVQLPHGRGPIRGHSGQEVQESASARFVEVGLLLHLR